MKAKLTACIRPTRYSTSQATKMTNTCEFKGWIANEPAADGRLEWGEFQPKKWEESDIDIRITHSAICGSDIHALRHSRVSIRSYCTGHFPCSPEPGNMDSCIACPSLYQ